MSKVDRFIAALDVMGNGSNHYWNGSSGIGCSDYVRLALGKAGIITPEEANNPYVLWAAQRYRSVLRDKTRFEELPVGVAIKKGDIMWEHGFHVYVDGGGNHNRYEAAPESTHGVCSNGKTGVGLWINHDYDCSGGSLTCIYRIIEDSPDVQERHKSLDVRNIAIDLALGKYGKTAYDNTYPNNVGRWDVSKWTFDCLGFVHTLTSLPNRFSGDKSKLGGGSTMNGWVLTTNEAATLASCTDISKFNGKEPMLMELFKMSGHVGFYIGDYKVTRSNGTVDEYNTAECTPRWGGGVLLSYTDLSNGYRYNKKGGEQRGIWDFHGKLTERIDYSDQEHKEPIMPEPEEPKPLIKLSLAEKFDVAKSVSKGEWGVNPQRRERLTIAYGLAQAIQIQDLINFADKDPM